MTFFCNKYRMLIILALVTGLAIDCIDTQTHRDDTGVTAGMILISLPEYILAAHSISNPEFKITN